MLYQILTILLFSLPLINAATLDGTCANDEGCVGFDLTCINEKCQCKMPWYKPCRSRCEVVSSVSYAGETCKIQQNCILYAACINNTICACMPGFEEKNGACFKALNKDCQNHNECWSNYCADSKCQCPPGTSETDSLTCEKKLLNAYDSLQQATERDEFCFYNDSCLDISATCKADPAHPGNKFFCQCSSDSKVENGKCERIKGQHLSPLDKIPTDYGKCGECEDTNAVCIQAASEKTCWCRSGFEKKDTKCQKHHDKQTLIFPNQGDAQAHNFTKDCPWDTNSGLCVCPSGYTFDEASRSCVEKSRKWQNDIFEYGVCTQINSNDQARAQQKLCPEPLKCIAKGDKHVCSCGPDQFLNLANTSQCVYYIGKGGSDANGACPQHTLAKTAGQNCQCQDGYKATDNDRQCELKLSEESDSAVCNTTLSGNTVCITFGDAAFLCRIGECRCRNGESAPNPEQTYCYAILNTTLSSPYPWCPSKSSRISDRCICHKGYKATDNKLTCVKKDLELVSHEGDPSRPNTVDTTEDCTALFTGPVEFYADNKCRCRQDAVLNDASTGCWFKLNVLSDPSSESECPPNSMIQSKKCNCRSGFRDNNNNRCVPIQEFVYNEAENRAENVADFLPGACILLFGQASEKSSKGNYCICKETIAFPRNDNKYCHYYINVPTSDLKNNQTCPEHSEPTSETPLNRCACKAGYEVTTDNKSCKKIESVRLVGFGVNPGPNDTSCVQRSTAECENVYGAHAFCRDELCYCDKRYHYLTTDGKCGKISGVFPGEQELDIYSCRTTADCQDKKFVICDYFHGSTGFKVCQCEAGVFWDPDKNECDDDRCLNCDESLGFECRNHECQCKRGTYLNNDRCVKSTELVLHAVCDPTKNWQIAEDSSTTCDPKCNRTICQMKYKIEDSTCVLRELSSDKCLHEPSICTHIDPNAVCDKDKNHCLCKGGLYQSENRCETPVDFPCFNDNDCDNEMQCKGGRCACQEGQRIEDVSDAFGRALQRCVTSHSNSAKQYSQNLMLIFLASFLSLYFFF